MIAFGGKTIFEQAQVQVNYNCSADSINLNTKPIANTDNLAQFYQTVGNIPVLFINQSASSNALFDISSRFI